MLRGAVQPVLRNGQAQDEPKKTREHNMQDDELEIPDFLNRKKWSAAMKRAEENRWDTLLASSARGLFQFIETVGRADLNAASNKSA